ncbi:fumble-domain-containing protein [Kalaharituber pfeilii]|nr:fumble-domain-containing protein [Kalaharituber pfeilii]
MSSQTSTASASVNTLSGLHSSRPRTGTFERPGSVRVNVQGAFIVDDDSPGSPPRNGPTETKDIRLPYHKSEVSHIAVDIGGSLAKLVYFTRDPNGEGGKLNFKNFETERIDDLINFMDRLMTGGDTLLTIPEQDEDAREQIKQKRRRDGLHVMATGGGAYKFYDNFRERLGVEIYREDEMECLIVGLDFFINEIPEEVFTYSETDPMQFAETGAATYPYLLVNIGSGVSMIKVSGPQQFERIGGSSLGGGTLWGLLSLLTDATSFDEMLGMAEHGDNTAVDMLVGDIYGTDYGRIGLKSTTIASSFGKVFKKSQEGKPLETSSGSSACSMPTDRRKKFRQEDISRSLLYAISNNIGQIAYLQAQHHNIEHIYFGGSFIRGHHQTMNTLSYAIRFWSKGTKQAYFLRHEGYLGSVGAFLRRQPMRGWGRRYSAGELDGEKLWKGALGRGRRGRVIEEV